MRRIAWHIGAQNLFSCDVEVLRACCPGSGLFRIRLTCWQGRVLTEKGGS